MDGWPKFACDRWVTILEASKLLRVTDRYLRELAGRKGTKFPARAGRGGRWEVHLAEAYRYLQSRATGKLASRLEEPPEYEAWVIQAHMQPPQGYTPGNDAAEPWIVETLPAGVQATVNSLFMRLQAYTAQQLRTFQPNDALPRIRAYVDLELARWLGKEGLAPVDSCDEEEPAAAAPADKPA